MLTKKEAKEISLKKWKTILKEPTWYNLIQGCGFCDYVEERTKGSLELDCEHYCPLFPKVCSLFRKEKPNLYGRISNRIERNNSQTYTKKLIRQMIKAIKEAWN